MFYIIQFCILLISYGFLKKKIYSGLVFCSTWLFSLLFLGEQNFAYLQPKTLLLCGIMFVSMISGIVLSHKRGCSSLPKQDQLIINERLLLRILCILFVIFAYYFTVTLQNSGGFNLLLIRELNASGSEDTAFQGYTGTFLFFMIAQPLLTAISILYIYSKYKRCKVNRVILVLIVVESIMYLVTSAGRIFVVIIFCFCIALYFVNLKNRNIVIKTKKIVTYGVIGFVALNLMTLSRNSGDVSFSEQLQEYIGCSIVNMDEELSVVDKNLDHNSINCGFYAFGGFLYYPIKFINIITGLDITIPQDDLDYLQAFKLIDFHGREIYYNALVPNIFYYYFDSGIIGVFLFSLLFGYLIGKYEHMADTSFLSFAIYAVSIYYLIFSPMGSQLWKPYMPTTLAWCIYLSKKLIINSPR